MIALLACLAALQATGTDVGQAHPDFLLPTIDEDAFGGLRDYRGKKVLLINFASW